MYERIFNFTKKKKRERLGSWGRSRMWKWNCKPSATLHNRYFKCFRQCFFDGALKFLFSFSFSNFCGGTMSIRTAVAMMAEMSRHIEPVVVVAKSSAITLPFNIIDIDPGPYAGDFYLLYGFNVIVNSY